MKRFCVECGKEIAKGTLCKECTLLEFDYKDVHPSFCVSCNRLLFHNKWFVPHNNDIEDGIAKVVEDSVKGIKGKNGGNASVKVLGFEIPEIKGPGQDIKFNVPILFKGAEAEIPAILSTTLCDKCSKQGTQYFEAVLQIRPNEDEVVKFAMNDLEKQKSKGVFVTKTEKENEGYNIYVTNQTYAKVLARKIREQFGAVVSINETLFSMNRQTSRDVFRLAVLIQLPQFSSKDMLVFQGRHYQITSAKKAISVVNLETGQKTSLPLESNYKDKYSFVPSCSAQITKMHPALEVLHPETFESVAVANASRVAGGKEIKIGGKLKVAFDTEGAWAFI